MANWIFYPPLKHMSGGCMVLVQLARHMHQMGCLQGLLYWDTLPSEYDQTLPWVRATDASLCSEDRLIVPEGWPNALALGLRAGCQCTIYCQNWSYLFHGLDQEVRWNALPVDFWAVSHPVAWYLAQVLGQHPPIIRPAIDDRLFFPPTRKPDGPARIGFMPRKNKALAEQIQRIFTERNPALPVQWLPVHGLSQAGVAEVLRSCHIFLSTGFPEGCPLPPLEAMACGCLCVGFTGFGGWDYMRQGSDNGYAPQGYVLRDTPWSGNGWWCADGDVLGAALGLEWALGNLKNDLLHTQAAHTATSYTFAAQGHELAAALSIVRRAP
ncbi:MAG: glycosyltransferase family 4 protein [Desulfovibrionales bacterium]|nr:glycosyltransferase family 4 protein [Desulfovibrionales bacterium]